MLTSHKQLFEQSSPSFPLPPHIYFHFLNYFLSFSPILLYFFLFLFFVIPDVINVIFLSPIMILFFFFHNHYGNKRYVGCSMQPPQVLEWFFLRHVPGSFFFGSEFQVCKSRFFSLSNEILTFLLFQNQIYEFSSFKNNFFFKLKIFKINVLFQNGMRKIILLNFLK